MFFDSNGIGHIEFIPEGATVKRICFKEIFDHLRDSIRRKLCHTLRIHLISHHANFVSFPEWKHSYVGVDFIRPKRLWLPQEKPYGTSLPTCFSGAPNSYTNIDRRSYRPMETILKEDVDLFKCTPCYAASCETTGSCGCLHSRHQPQNSTTVVVGYVSFSYSTRHHWIT